MLKALTYAPTGGIVAAPTTSLPEQHRRRAQLGLPLLLGARRDADAERAPLCRLRRGSRPGARGCCARRPGNPEDLQIMYGVAGEQRLVELELDWLPGYEGSAPGAHGQPRERAGAARRLRRADGRALPGAHARPRGERATRGRCSACCFEFLERRWREPDNGIWEIRGEPQHFVHSKVMAWVAFDRAVKSIEEYGLKGDLERWRAIRDEIHEEVCREGFDARARLVHAVLRLGDARREPAADPARGFPAAATTRGCAARSSAIGAI